MYEKNYLQPNIPKETYNTKKHDIKLFEKIEKQLHIFSLDPRHHSLRLHKLKGDLKNVWSISITTDFRLNCLDFQFPA